MRSQFAFLPGMITDLSRRTRLFIGLSVATLVCVFAPIMALNAFGVWPNAYHAYGDHVFLAFTCVLASVSGVKTGKIWACFLTVLSLIIVFQCVMVVKAKPMDDWLSAYPAFTRSAGGMLLSGLVFNWFAKRTDLLTHSKDR